MMNVAQQICCVRTGKLRLLLFFLFSGIGLTALIHVFEFSIYDGDAALLFPFNRLLKQPEHGRDIILVWKHPWGVETEGPRSGPVVGRKCIITYDRRKLKKAKAIVFHYTALDAETFSWRHYRNQSQLFVYYNMESPSYVFHSEKREHFYKFDKSFINVTMTYRSDANVSAIYRLEENIVNTILHKDGKHWVDSQLKKKERLALWLVSDCALTQGAVLRRKYSDELVQAGVSIDRYGNCFHNREEFDKLPSKVVDSYKFYLAFENALHCKDYITEKFWRNALSKARVPIVWGPSKQDITRLAPPKSFIHTEDFDSPATLASYLQYLDKNDTAYREYFNWIENPDEKTLKIAKLHSTDWPEKLCDFIRRKEKKHSSFDSVTNYFRNENKLCFNPDTKSLQSQIGTF